jgi:hypothetical protein
MLSYEIKRRHPYYILNSGKKLFENAKHKESGL